uniref:Uncharacterized protein n=2 Tax=Odontella aurita TaxID=265563 RepID=A0A7S4KDF7_9STRA|mmetsp:Transcript_988/g.2832  ORF Transcript_988/g.2832 Transcript_988/m.2832 type:complete len:118 (+) Transcript_988:433-786(+)
MKPHKKGKKVKASKKRRSKGGYIANTKSLATTNPVEKKKRYSGDSKKKGYNCGKCGVPKKDHICPFDKSVSNGSYEEEMKAKYDEGFSQGQAAAQAVIRNQLLSRGIEKKYLEDMGI